MKHMAAMELAHEPRLRTLLRKVGRLADQGTDRTCRQTDRQTLIPHPHSSETGLPPRRHPLHPPHRQGARGAGRAASVPRPPAPEAEAHRRPAAGAYVHVCVCIYVFTNARARVCVCVCMPRSGLKEDFGKVWKGGAHVHMYLDAWLLA